jgi:HTH-type transcriptional regulator / antitoxin HipB
MIMRPKSGQRDTPGPSVGAIREAEGIGEAVRQARKRLELSQDDVAFAAHVSPRTVFAIEKGKATVRLDMLARVLAAVGLRLATAPRDRVWRPAGDSHR